MVIKPNAAAKKHLNRIRRPPDPETIALPKRLSR
jgi:hypothetical protein